MCHDSVINYRAISNTALERYDLAVNEKHMHDMQDLMLSYHPNTARHQNGAGLLAAELTVHFALDEKDAKDVIQAARYHDFGKLAVDTAILDSREKLTQDEKNLIKMHPETGFYEVVKITNNPELAIPVLAHHTLQPDSYPSIESVQKILEGFGIPNKVINNKKTWLKNLIVIAADQGEAWHPSENSTHPYASRDYPAEEVEQKIKLHLSKSKLIEELHMTEQLKKCLRTIGKIAIKSSSIILPNSIIKHSIFKDNQ